MSDIFVDDVVIVDWSAAASPKLGRDSIWIAHVATGEAPVTQALINLATRTEAFDWLTEVFHQATSSGRHLVCGFDFSFGYPAGYGALLERAFPELAQGTSQFERVLSITSALIDDAETNENNRFAVADLINARTGLSLFWGHPPKRRYGSLSPTKKVPDGLAPNPLPALRLTDRDLSVGSNWQLTGVGSVGSQVLTGLPVISKLLRGDAAPTMWPFQPHRLCEPGGAVLMAEVWPSMFQPPEMTHAVRDAWQVESAALALARLTTKRWATLLAPQSWSGMSEGEQHQVLDEEGWILGKI